MIFKNLFIIIIVAMGFLTLIRGSCYFPPATGTINQPTTINVKKYKNFNYVRLVATSSLRKQCSIDECVSGKNIIEIENGGTIENLILGDPAKGIWCKGSCTLKNVFFEKTCYHGADLGNSLDSTPRTFQIIGGAAKNVLDKIFTQSGAGTTTISNFCADNFHKVARSCGMGCVQHQRTINIKDSKFFGPALTIFALNANYKDKMFVSNVAVGKSIIYGCQEYNGIVKASEDIHPTGECTPKQDCKLNSCKYSKSAFKIIN